MTDSIKAKLTEASGNRVDFFNIGGLAKERTQKTLWGLWNNYTWRELFIRGGIVFTAAACGILAAQSCNDDSNECSPLTRGITAAGLGFFFLHTAALLPTVHRRNKIKVDTQELIDDIEKTLTCLNEKYSPKSPQHETCLILTTKIKQIYGQIQTLRLPLIKKGDAVQNLLTIKTLIRNMSRKIDGMHNQLNANKDDASEEGAVLNLAKDFWDQHFDIILEELKNTDAGKSTLSKHM